MSRRLIIIFLGLLIIAVIGGTAALVIQRLRNRTTPTATPTPGTDLPPGQTRTQTIADPTGDDDADGLSNGDESRWGTDPTNPDTDGDTYKDGEEVTAQHNPTISAPNDKLPAGFEPGKEVTPLSPAASQPLAVDQFFADNLDLSGGSRNVTDAYKQQVSEADRTPDTLVAFARQQPIVTKLPTPASKAILLQASDTPLVLREYMEVAGNLAVFSNRTLLAEAINDLFQNNDPSGIRGLALTIRLHQENLITLRVPPSAEPLHKLLLGYTELLAATYEQMAKYPEDPVKGVIGMRQLEEIDRTYYPLIEQEVDRLQATIPSS